jgi:formylglycine-generating enzyme required for sulfatase activity
MPQGTAPEETIADAQDDVTEADTEAGEEPETVTEQAAPVQGDPALAANTRGSLPGSEFSDSLSSGSRGPTLVVVPADSFDMGSGGSSGNTDERPRHAVNVRKFAISKHEITFQEYNRFAAATGRARPDNQGLDRASYPVFYVSWDDANEYTRWLSRQTGQRYNLPSESQWEYAAGTGSRAIYWWGYEDIADRAHCFGCSPGLDPSSPTRIGSFEPNKFGIHDTAGNVAEWVSDCWHENYNEAPEHDGVWKGGDCSSRVVRGGSYSTPFSSIRHANRDKYDPNGRYDNIGFRVVREVQ